MFSAMDVLSIVGAFATVSAVYFGIRSLIQLVKYDTGVIREWIETEGKQQLNELHKWHDVRDGDGVLVWHVTQSLKEAMIKQAEGVVAIGQSIDKLADVMERMDKRNTESDQINIQISHKLDRILEQKS